MVRRFIFVLTLVLLCMAGLQAQRSRFVYLQTDDLTPFYIQMNGKNLSSTAAGYLLIGKLADSIYPIKLGVLGSSDVQDYAIKVEGKDAGYVVKKSESQGWTLTNLQTNTVQRSMEYASALAAEAARKEALMTAEKQRVADSLAAATARAEQRKKDSIAAEQTMAQAKKDSVNAAAMVVPAAVAATAGSTPEKKSETASGGQTASAGGHTGVGAAAVVVPTAIAGAVISSGDKKATENKKTGADTAVGVTAKAAPQSKADSIAAVIAQKEKELKDLQAALAATTAVAATDSAGANAENASNKQMVAMDTVPASGAANKAKNNTGAVVAATATTAAAGAVAATGNPALLDMEFSMGKDSATTKKADSIPATATTTAKSDTMVTPAAVVVPAAVVKDTVTTNPVADTVAPSTKKANRQACAGVVSREEVETAIAAAGKLSDADEKLKVLTAVFNDKCISTTHLKKIASSLASDVTRYKLFEAAYLHTVDYYAYGELGGLISDTYYSNKFKSLIQP